MKKHIYFYEGETEKKVINTLKENEFIPHGSAKKFNFWQKEANKILRQVSQSSVLYIVFDTDMTDTIASEKFIKNIKLLEDNVKTIYLIAQHKNLEDELCYACSNKNNEELFEKFYRTKDKKEFKKKLINESDLFNKLDNNGLTIEKLWSRKDIYSTTLSTIQASNKIKIGLPTK